MRILIVEDDSLLGEGLRAGLSQHGFTIDWLQEGRLALHALRYEKFDATVLDLGLPDMDGAKVLLEYRKQGEGIPILVLTARNAIGQKLVCLEGGADDYLIKPVDIRELAARLHVLLRRREGRSTSVLRHADVELDPHAHRVSLGSERIELSPREFKILHILLHSRGRVISKEQLEQHVYGWETDVDSNAVQVHVHNIRRKLGPDVIQTVRGVGYIID
jgi:two-component system OmpR family response regulator/two-component system response regulator QseB